MPQKKVLWQKVSGRQRLQLSSCLSQGGILVSIFTSPGQVSFPQPPPTVWRQNPADSSEDLKKLRPGFFPASIPLESLTIAVNLSALVFSGSKQGQDLLHRCTVWVSDRPSDSMHLFPGLCAAPQTWWLRLLDAALMASRGSV